MSGCTCQTWKTSSAEFLELLKVHVGAPFPHHPWQRASPIDNAVTHDHGQSDGSEGTELNKTEGKVCSQRSCKGARAESHQSG